MVDLQVDTVTRAVILIITANAINKTNTCISIGEKNKVNVAIVVVTRDSKNLEESLTT